MQPPRGCLDLVHRPPDCCGHCCGCCRHCFLTAVAPAVAAVLQAPVDPASANAQSQYKTVAKEEGEKQAAEVRARRWHACVC